MVEDYAEELPSGDQEHTLWAADPVDGTINFVHGLPFFGISIARIERGWPVLGVIHAPALGETFTAVAATGAYVNGHECHVSHTATLADSVMSTGLADSISEASPDNIKEFSRMTRNSHGVRRFGSGALELAYVACGRLDGYWESGQRPWDLAAGALLVAEAGGQVTDYSGGDTWLFQGDVVALNGLIHAALLDAVKQAQQNV